MASAWILAASAGSLDALGFLILGNIFVAHMSGNITSSGVYVGSGRWADAMRHFWPIPIFALGVLAGAILVEIAVSYKVRSPLIYPFILEIALLIAFASVSFSLPPSYLSSKMGGVWVATLPCMAMGIQNTTLRRVGGEGIRTTFVTGMLTNFVEELANRIVHRHFEKKGFPVTLWGGVWVVYLLSAAIGSALFVWVRIWALAFPLLGLVLALVKELISPSTGVSEIEIHRA